MTSIAVARVNRAPIQRSSSSLVLRRILLLCGVGSSLLYGTMLVFVPLRWHSYSSISQTVSELSAIGAPTRALWSALGSIYGALALAFGLGVWLSANRSLRLRVAGAALIAQSFLGYFWPPMHLRGVAPTLTDAMHVVFAMAWLLLMLLSMAFAAGALGKGFRLYTTATLALFVVFGALTSIDGPRIATNQPTPLVGVWERINIGASLVWIVVLAITLLKRAESQQSA